MSQPDQPLFITCPECQQPYDTDKHNSCSWCYPMNERTAKAFEEIFGKPMAENEEYDFEWCKQINGLH